MQTLPINSSAKPCVVITRPQKQAKIWAEKLQANKIESISLPMLEIRCFQDDHHEQWIRPIKNCMLDLDLYHKIIFVSQNAVECAMPWIENYWPQIPVGIDFFAIGETTANLLASYGVPVENLATSDNSDMTSEALLMHHALQSVTDEKILIVRGVGGRGHLGDILQQRGAIVNYCEVYQRCVPADAQTQINQWLENQQNWLDNQYILAFHSSETWNCFYSLLQKIQATNAIDTISKVKKLPLVVPSERVQQDVNASGFYNTILAKNATDDAMTQAINHYLWSKPA